MVARIAIEEDKEGVETKKTERQREREQRRREEISEPQHKAVLPSEEAGYLQSDDFRVAKRPAAERRHRPL